MLIAAATVSEAAALCTRAGGDGGALGTDGYRCNMAGPATSTLAALSKVDVGAHREWMAAATTVTLDPWCTMHGVPGRTTDTLDLWYDNCTMASETQAPEVGHSLIRGMPMRPLHHVCAVAPMWCALKYPETCLPLGIDPSGVSQVAGHVAMDYLEAMASDGVFWAIALRCLMLAFASLFWTFSDGLPGDEGVGRCLLGHRAALPNAGFRQPVLAWCRWRSGGA